MESYLCSKAELLADHLQACIQRGELPNPLPNIRQWSVRLGVSHGTLESALGILKQRGLLESRPRKGIYIKSHSHGLHRCRSCGRCVGSHWVVNFTISIPHHS